MRREAQAAFTNRHLCDESKRFKLAVELDVTLPQVDDPEKAARIVAAGPKVWTQCR